MFRAIQPALPWDRGIGGGTGDLDKGNPWPGERGEW